MSASLRRTVPASAYRLQLRRGIGFAEALDLVPYLHDLSVDALYLSPVLVARAGSTHGYDIVDPTALYPALGTLEQLESLSEALRRRSMGLVLDIVPNHLGVAGGANAWWTDVLENGPASVHANAFDIDWDPPREDLKGRVLLPILGDSPESVIERGEIRLERDGERVLARYHEHALPLCARSRAGLGEAEIGPLARMTAARLREVLDMQFWRLAHWRDAACHVNYRRFFDITDLAALREEDPDVFARRHVMILDIVRRDIATALRVDHVDGMFDPRGYLERLRAAAREARGGSPCAVFVEKILAREESLPPEWPVTGTTGYEAIDHVGGWFVDPEGARSLHGVHRDFLGDRRDFEDVLHEARREILLGHFGAELERLQRQLAGVIGEAAATSAALRDALVEVIAAFPVYRTYVRDGEDPAPADRHALGRAMESAGSRLAPAARPALDLLADVLLMRGDAAATEAGRSSCRQVVMRLQQLTAPVAAKGLEDTALFRHAPLGAVAEVSCRPDATGTDTQALHAWLSARQAAWPDGMTTLTTHDTKRSADVRCRLAALSEIPEAWHAALARWHSVAVEHGSTLHAAEEYLLFQFLLGMWPRSPSTAAGRAALVPRVQDCLVKAMREAKRCTSWTHPDAAHEAAARGLVEAILGEEGAWWRDLEDVARPIARAGARTSLSLLVLGMAMPGVPDVYQGCEVPSFALIDPDNRRPVDFGALRAMLDEVLPKGDDGAGQDSARAVGAIARDPEDPRLKLLVTARALNLRRTRRDLFARGSYVPLRVRGPAARRVMAFARRHEGESVIAVASRFFMRGADDFAGTELILDRGAHEAAFRDALSSATHRATQRDGSFTLPVSALLAHLPATLLETIP